MKKIILCYILFAFVACLNHNQKQEEAVIFLDNLGETKFKISMEDKIYTGERTCIMMFSENNKFKLCQGYIDCPLDSIRTIDSIDHRINECHKIINFKDDTIKFYYTPGEIGTYDFKTITLLFHDQNNLFYVGDTTFKITVLPK